MNALKSKAAYNSKKPVSSWSRSGKREKTSVTDPDLHGSGAFAWIRNYSSVSGSSKKLKEEINKNMKCYY